MKVSPGGAVVIPPSLQEEVGIHPGAEVELREENGAIVIRRHEPDEETRAFYARLEAMRGAYKKKAERPSAQTLEEVAGLSRGEQFVRLLADAGVGRMTTDELMEFLRGPYEDLDPR